jgi:succinate dehydrogenase flavin-adding protein (antitoxin of CptAB toxin-antitoxin module)
MKELDLLLERYLRQQWATASSAEKTQFEAFLELPDPTIAAYLLGHEVASDPCIRTLVAALRSGRAPLATKAC